VHRLRARRQPAGGDRRDAPGGAGPGRRVRRAGRSRSHRKAPARLIRRRSSTAATASSRAWALAAWPTSTSPRTSCWAGRWRSRSFTTTSPKTRSSSSASALSHPNIVGIFDRGEWNGTYYIAMEYVAGRSLKTIVREQGPLEPAMAIEIVIQILRAARFAHRRGVIHRDLKPHNVIIDEEGRARVTDFGIARAGASDMTLTGSIMGTAQYLSPEQAQGYAVSGASDLYSVGVILYELLTGVVPFEGETAVAIAFKQVSATPRAPSELNPALPPSLDAVVLRALAKDPPAPSPAPEELFVALQHERAALPAFSGAAVASAYEPRHVPPATPPMDGPTGALLLAPGGPLREEYPAGE